MPVPQSGATRPQRAGPPRKSADFPPFSLTGSPRGSSVYGASRVPGRPLREFPGGNRAGRRLAAVPRLAPGGERCGRRSFLDATANDVPTTRQEAQPLDAVRTDGMRRDVSCTQSSATECRSPGPPCARRNDHRHPRRFSSHGDSHGKANPAPPPGAGTGASPRADREHDARRRAHGDPPGPPPAHRR